MSSDCPSGTSVTFGPFVAASAEDCSLGQSKYLQYHPSKLATPPGGGVEQHDYSENGFSRAVLPNYIEVVGAGDEVSTLLSSNAVESKAKATGASIVYTEVMGHAQGAGQGTSRSPCRVVPKQMQQRTLFDDIDEDLRKLGAGSYATPSGAGSPSKRNLNSLSPEASPTKPPRGEGIYTSSANASAFSTSVAIGKRKQEICLGIGKVIVEATERIKLVK